jgi:competence ComEA-like helix-hairpin-helix protein
MQEDRALAEAVLEFRRIESVLEDGEPCSESGFRLPLVEVLSLLPEDCVRDTPPRRVRAEDVLITVDDLFSQLSRGRVRLSVAELACFVPAHLLTHTAFTDRETTVTLPLEAVVRAVGLERLARNTSATVRRYDLSGLENPFDGSESAVDVQLDAPETDDSPALKSEESSAPEPAPPAAEVEAHPDAIGIALPLADILRLLPSAVVADGASAAAGDRSVTVRVEDLFAQLAKGRVRIRAAELARVVPREMVVPSAMADDETMVTLPLDAVVKAVGIERFRELMPTGASTDGVERLGDPFSESTPSAEIEPDEAPSLEPAPAERPAETPHAPAPEIRPSPVRETEPPFRPKVRPSIQPAPVPQTGGAGNEEWTWEEVPGNVNINTASAPELLSLQGMTPRLAALIVRHRETHGSFSNIFSLQEIPGLGRKTFRRLTGMPLSARAYHRRRKLAQLLGVPVPAVGNLQAVADALSQQPGFAGCMISDADGLLVAQSGAAEVAEAMSAVVPRMARQVREAMSLLNAGQVDSVSVSIRGTLYTVVTSETMAMTAIHQEARITKKQLSLVRRVAREVGWLLSHRAYAGNPTIHGG